VSGDVIITGYGPSSSLNLIPAPHRLNGTRVEGSSTGMHRDCRFILHSLKPGNSQSLDQLYMVQGWGRHTASFPSGANTITRTSRTSNSWQSEVSQFAHKSPPIRFIQERVSKPEQTRILCVPDPTHSRPACKLSSASRALFCTATNNGGVQHDPQLI
jgi:hypothetical protein